MALQKKKITFVFMYYIYSTDFNRPINYVPVFFCYFALKANILL
uniref:Uncharacterized protein n=1 Tax=Anguilla anguilla TaxID=7936 RepID=A0A0E9S3Z3_ANGAN